MTTNGNGLTTKQRVFIETYLENGFNATDAARQAGYKYPNVEGPKNLVKPSIREKLNTRLDALTLTTEEALAKENEIARFDISPYVDGAGRLMAIDIKKLKEAGLGHLIRSVKQTAHGTVIELANPDDARDRILKARGAYTNRLDITSDGEKIQAIAILNTDTKKL